MKWENGKQVEKEVVRQPSEIKIRTLLLHESGEYMTGTTPFPVTNDDIQSVGSVITYGRRYSLASLSGVLVSDEDDDGEEAMDRPKSRPQPSRQAPGGQQSKPATATPEQVREIKALIAEHNVDEQTIRAWLNKARVDRLEQLAPSQIQSCIDFLKDRKSPPAAAA